MNKKEPIIVLRHEMTNVYVIAGRFCEIPTLRAALDLNLRSSVNAEYDDKTNVTVVTEYINNKEITPLTSTSES